MSLNESSSLRELRRVGGTTECDLLEGRERAGLLHPVLVSQCPQAEWLGQKGVPYPPGGGFCQLMPVLWRTVQV